MGSLRVGHDKRLHFHFSLSCIGEGNGNPLQCSSLENPRDGAAWWAAVYGVTQSQTWLKRLSSSSSSIYVLLTQFLETNPKLLLCNRNYVFICLYSHVFKMLPGSLFHDVWRKKVRNLFTWCTCFRLPKHPPLGEELQKYVLLFSLDLPL